MSNKANIALLALVAFAATLLTAPAPATAAGDCEPVVPSFGLCGLDLTIVGSDGTSAPLAGSHPFAIEQSIAVKTEEGPSGEQIPSEEAKDFRIILPPGFAGNPTAAPQCPVAEFLAGEDFGECENATAVGIAEVEFVQPGFIQTVPIFNLEPSPGTVAKIGFMLVGRAPVTVDVGLSPNPPYNAVATASYIAQAAFFYRAETTLWGVPTDPIHDALRGKCIAFGGSCPASIAPKPFVTLPTGCEGPLRTDFEADSWQKPGLWVKAPPLFTHDDSDPPNPVDLGACDKLGFAPQTAARPSTDRAESPSGLDFELNVEDEGLTSPTGTSQSVIKKAVVTLPAGVTVNPSVAEGLRTCSPAQLANETLSSEPGDGCPEASKVGSIEVETPLLEGKLIRGSVFVATQDDPSTPQPGAENPFDSLIALYMVVKDPGLGLLIKLPARVEPDEEAGPDAGRLVTTLGEPGYEIPQIAQIAHFRLHLSEGARSPLITPARCGTYTTDTLLTPWSNPSKPLNSSSSFKITSGVGGAPCPPAGPPPFDPGFSAGTVNNDAGSYSPFDLRLTRRDGDQDLTKFSSVLPPGVIGKLAGIAKCPDSAIAVARAKTGRAELASPSCPAGSQIGHTLAGAGVGSQLTYVSGSLYLGGPVGGDPLSVIAITPAVAGPFDAGTVVVREALSVDPVTAEVEADGAHSDPIPHVLKGIVLKVRDLRIDVDRPDFILNPTNCEPSEARATAFGSFVNVFDPTDDVPVSLVDRFQAANCASRAFRPRLAMSLAGGTRRAAHPSFRTVLSPRPGDANFDRVVVTLPRSAFLDQGHIRTICTRVQFAAHACPPGSIYGHAVVRTPILDEPLTGPVYLRSSNHKLPDIVLALHGIVDVELVGRVDSHRGGIRTSFEAIPDAPASKAIVTLLGGRKGLVVNSRNLCVRRSRATVRMVGQNGRHYDPTPLVRPIGCKANASNLHRRHSR